MLHAVESAVLVGENSRNWTGQLEMTFCPLGQLVGWLQTDCAQREGDVTSELSPGLEALRVHLKRGNLNARENPKQEKKKKA